MFHFKDYLGRGKVKFGMYNYDSDKLPVGFAKNHVYADRIIQISNYARDTLLKAGVPKEKVVVMDKGDFIIFQFPTTKNIENIEIQLLRPNNDKKDVTVTEKNTKNVMIEKKKLEKGIYKVSIHYTSQGQRFLQKEELKIN